MPQNLEQSFKNAAYRPEGGLAVRISRTIAVRNRRRALTQFWVFAFLGMASAVAIVPVFKMLLGDFSRSGFYEYVSVAFSSGSAVLSYFKEFAASIAESLPVGSILFTLGLVFVFFMSLRYAAKEAVRGRLSLSFKM